MRRFSFILCMAWLFLPLVQAQVKYSNDFLNIGTGARNLSMSNATVASVADATAGYLNPSGLNSIQKKWSVGAMHAEYFAGIANYDYLSTVRRIDGNSVLGVSAL